MKARKQGDVIEITFPYDARLVALMKSFPGRKYSPQTKAWYIPIAGSSEAIEKLRRWQFSIDPDLLSAIEENKRVAEEVEALQVMDDAPFDTLLPLFPYQKVGAAFLYKIGSGLLGDEPGTGKTIQSIAVCQKIGALKVLVFCPAAVKYQWADEIERFIPGMKIVVIDGDKKAREKLWQSEAQYYIANYELLLRDIIEMQRIEWDICIADEATRISNPRAKQTKALKKLKAKRRLALTGTPISNRADEIWSIIDWTNPGSLGDYWGFLQRYCLKNYFGAISGYQNMDELNRKLKRYMIRRLKVDVLPDLPEKIVTDIPFELSKEEKKLYKNIKREILFEIEKADISKLENPMTLQYTLTKMIRLRQLADSMELLGDSKKSTKIEILKEILQENVVNGRKAIIFTQFAKMADILERELSVVYKTAVIQGNTSSEDRVTAIKNINVGETQLLVMTAAGSMGINLQGASTVIHFDQEWSLAKMKQREGRVWRHGQKERVQVFNLLARGTIDYYIVKVLRAKEKLSDQILGDVPFTIGDIKEMLEYE